MTPTLDEAMGALEALLRDMFVDWLTVADKKMTEAERAARKMLLAWKGVTA